MKTKTLILALGCALMLAGVVADDAHAGPFGKKSKRTDNEQKVWRYDQFPEMQFARGKLRQDIHTGWQIGNVTVQLAPDCTVVDDEGPAQLRDGAAAMIIGPRAGDTIIAWRIEILAPGEMERTDVTPGGEFIPSEANRHVGVGSGPN